MVAWLDGADARTDRFHDARAFVTERQGERHGIVLSTGMEIGLTDAARDHADQHLGRARFVELQVLEPEPAALLVDDRCVGPHLKSPSSYRKERLLDRPVQNRGQGCALALQHLQKRRRERG